MGCGDFVIGAHVNSTRVLVAVGQCCDDCDVDNLKGVFRPSIISLSSLLGEGDGLMESGWISV
jgi:hypothetical protein